MARDPLDGKLSGQTKTPPVAQTAELCLADRLSPQPAPPPEPEESPEAAAERERRYREIFGIPEPKPRRRWRR